MSRCGQKQIDKGTRKVIARLMHLHHQTHPDRLAQRFNVTAQYVRMIWAKCSLDEHATLREALGVYLASPDTVPRGEPQQGAG